MGINTSVVGRWLFRTLNKNVTEITGSHSQAIQKIELGMGVRSHIQIDNRKILICLTSLSGNLMGTAIMSHNVFYYRTEFIKVSKVNQGMGCGRLLQLLMATEAVKHCIGFKFPSFSFSTEGRRSFEKYPLNPFVLLQYKIPLALDQIKPVKDIPWEEPPITVETRYR